MSKVVILDIDNCISDDSWRIKYIHEETSSPHARYHDYHMLSCFDVPTNLSNIICDADDIVVFTARPSEYRFITLEWLKRRAGIEPRLLMMRGMNDTRPSKELKKAMLHALLRNTSVVLSDVVAAYDDREDVVKMYLNHGVPGRVLRCHEIPYPTQKG